jgi:hypothetical protein
MLAMTNSAWRCIRQAVEKRACIAELESQGIDAEELRLSLLILEQAMLHLAATRQHLLRAVALASSHPEVDGSAGPVLRGASLDRLATPVRCSDREG